MVVPLKTTIFLLALSLIGCGLPDAPYLYKSGCLTEIESELELNQTALDFNVELAQRYFIESNNIDSTETFCSSFGTLRIHVSDSDYIGDKLGKYDLFYGVLLTKSMSSLLHELFHALDTSRWQVGTIFHEGWDENRRNEYDRKYGFAIERVYPQVYL